MKGYLILYMKKTEFLDLEFYENKLTYLFNLYYGETPVVNTKLINNIICMNISTEVNIIENNIPSYFWGYSGYINEDNIEIIKLLRREDKEGYISDLGGSFSLVIVDGERDRVEAWNNITRVEPVYWGENEDFIVVGNKLLLVHLFNCKKSKPLYSLESIMSFINNGYYADESLPFKNVNILPIASKVVIENQRINIKNYLDRDILFKTDASEETYDELTSLFRESFKGLKRERSDINLGLTGGKDSRLIIAGLYNENIDFRTFTNGFESSPDVIVAKQISNVLNISHTAKSPSKRKEDHITVNLQDRLRKSICMYEGLLSGYENVTNNSGFKENHTKIGGQGGELLRGGYARNYFITEKSKFEETIKRLLLNNNKYLNKDRASDYELRVWKYINSQLKTMSYNDVLNILNLEYRAGRWSGASKPAYSFNSHMYIPFFDNKLINKIVTIKTKYGSNEHIIYNILKRIEPKLIDIPFANDRWNFEKQNPLTKDDLSNWIKRKPYYPSNQRSSFNWRRALFNNFKEELYDIIFLKESSDIFNVIDKNKIKNIFEKKNSLYNDYLLWNLATLSFLFSNKWIEEDVKPKRTKIIIPEEKEKTISVLSEIKGLTSNYLTSLHRKLHIASINNYGANIKWDKFVCKSDRLYFQLFDHNFKTPPSQSYQKIASIDSISELKFVFEYFNNTLEEININVFLMTYDNIKRLRNLNFSKKLLRDTSGFIEVNANLKKEELYYKIAIRIFKAPAKGEFSLNQMRIEYYK